MANRRYDANYEPRPAERAREEELRYQRFLSVLERASVGPRPRCELHPRSRPERFGRDELVARVGEELALGPADAEHAVRTVLQAARGMLSEKEASDVAAHLPKDMQDLWAPAA